jgi:hypothetical protein
MQESTLPLVKYVPIAQSGQSGGLLILASGVRIPLGSPIHANIAPMVERLFCNQDVEGSSPSVSTIYVPVRIW